MKLTLDAFKMRVRCLQIISAQPMSSFRVQQNYQELQEVLQVPTLLHHGLTESGLNACICPGQDAISRSTTFSDSFLARTFF